ncbi:MAG: hypothetical protein KF843_11145 [Flavobacteriales bacterium]|nr:hypothetical protein [Flavobacteriales bacterium]
MSQAESWLRFAAHISEVQGRYDTQVKEIVLPAPLERSSALLEELSIANEIQQGEVHIEKESLLVSFFWDREELSANISSESFERDILVKDYGDGKPLYYVHSTAQVERLPNSPPADVLIENARCYFRLKHILKENSETSPDRFNLVDYFSEEQQRLVLLSSVDQRKAILNLRLAGIPKLDTTQAFKANLDAFEALLGDEGRYMSPFLKAAIIKQVLDQPEDGWNRLLAGLGAIIKEARTNLNVFLYGLSLAKIKDEYVDYKKRYFDEISALAKTFAGQVVVLPVTMIGSIYAAKQLEGNVLGMFALLLGLILYLAYITVLIRGHSKDATVIKGFSERDFLRLSSNEFFKHEQSEINEFKSAHVWIGDKVKFLILQLRLYYLIHLIVTAAMFCYGLYLIKMSPSAPLFWVLLIGACGVGYVLAFPTEREKQSGGV